MENNIKFDSKGLIPVITQDIHSGQVLMQAYMDAEALQATLSTGYMHYYSRSREVLWKKGETSGHVQKVVSGYADCDNDSLLFKVEQTGVACHTGAASCFFRKLFGEQGADFQILSDLMATIKDRKTHPIEGSYTNYLYASGLDKILKKLAEESAEVLIAAKNEEKESLVMEICDLIYHTMVLMSEKNIGLNDIYTELVRREGKTPEKKYSDQARIDRPDLGNK